MAKKPASVPVSRWQKKQPTKHITKRRKLKSVLKKIFNYMQSDIYLFAPLIHPQSSPLTSDEVSLKPMKKKKKKLLEEVYNYLKCDAFMYAPLAMDSAYDGTTSHSSSGDQCQRDVCDQIETRGDERTLTSSRDVDDGARLNPMRRIVVEHDLLHLHTERLKHVVHQNCRSLSATGEVLPPKKSRKVVVE